MKKIVVTAVLAILISTVAFSQNKDELAIREILSVQTQCWNNGNIDCFMEGYWKSDSLLFTGKAGPTYGWQKTLENYKKHYPDTTAMGKLQFQVLQLKKLSKEYYFMQGKWDLKRSIGDIGGYFTLLFRKINNKWVIVVDHTS